MKYVKALCVFMALVTAALVVSGCAAIGLSSSLDEQTAGEALKAKFGGLGTVNFIFFTVEGLPPRVAPSDSDDKYFWHNYQEVHHMEYDEYVGIAQALADRGYATVNERTGAVGSHSGLRLYDIGFTDKGREIFLDTGKTLDIWGGSFWKDGVGYADHSNVEAQQWEAEAAHQELTIENIAMEEDGQGATVVYRVDWAKSNVDPLWNVAPDILVRFVPDRVIRGTASLRKGTDGQWFVADYDQNG